MHNEDIDNFFSWFDANKASLTRISQSPGLQSELENRVDALDPRLAWEIGPGEGDNWSFTLTPDGDASLLGTTKYVISRAPAICGWEFHDARQPRDSGLHIDLETHDGVIEIVATDAEYALIRASDGTFDLLIKLPAAAVLKASDKQLLGTLLIDGLIGEKLRLSSVKNVQFVESFEDRYQGKSTPLKHLRDHLLQLLRRLNDDSSV